MCCKQNCINSCIVKLQLLLMSIAKIKILIQLNNLLIYGIAKYMGLMIVILCQLIIKIELYLLLPSQTIHNDL
mgnify:CR=1 FL=1|jgi:hypothetical protein